MKITVITDAKGEIIGTARFPKRDASHPVFKPASKQGQTVHEMELPAHLESVESGEELHNELKKHIRK